MSEIIKVEGRVIGGEEIQTVNARELHAFLEIGKDFSSCIKPQIERARLVEGRDFVKVTQKGKLSATGQTRIDYHLSLESAKHVAMMSGSDKGFEVREYFIECERRLKTKSIPSYPELLRQHADTLEQLEAAKPAKEFMGKYVDASGSFGFRQVCKLLGAKENEFRDFLFRKDIFYRLAGELAANRTHRGRTLRDENRCERGKSAQLHAERFTPKGVKWIAGLWAAEKCRSAATDAALN